MYKSGKRLWLFSVLILSLANAHAQNLIYVKVAGGTPGTPSGAAVIGTSGDVWNYFLSLAGRAIGGDVVTNATTIKDSMGATFIHLSPKEFSCPLASGNSFKAQIC
jgi:hypothetical protein